MRKHAKNFEKILIGRSQKKKKRRDDATGKKIYGVRSKQYKPKKKTKPKKIKYKAKKHVGKNFWIQHWKKIIIIRQNHRF